jgi:predicted glycosyltransferase
MKYLFQLNHPAHYHLFKNAIHQLKNDGHDVLILARPKDILIDLLKNEDFDFINIKKGTNILEKIKLNQKSKRDILEYTRKNTPDLIIGTGDFSYVTRKQGIPSIFLGEDDATLNLMLFLWTLTVYGGFSSILAPAGVNNSIWNKKTIFYNGYHKLAYLHPNQFKPDKRVVERYFNAEKPYFMLRFSKMNAYHDVNARGIDSRIAEKLVEILRPFGDIYITSERELEPEFEQFRLKIDPLDIHHVLYFSKLFIGDSQSMSVEASMLGVPSVRFNDFAGKISVLEELEHKYGLTFGIKTSESDQLFEKVEELLSMENLREDFQKRRQTMLADKIDVTAFLVWFIENYPESAQMMKEKPDYQIRFR